MTSKGLWFVCTAIIIQTCTINGQRDILKGSLIFVLDDTQLMDEEIRQVTDEIDTIFEKVHSSNVSQIENFVLVTFNDPTAELRIVTKDQNEYKTALAAINAHGGGDCPENAMTGIELALKESLPLSYLYVFTDASAKDHNKFEEIKKIAQKKQSQINFILTGKCGNESDPGFQVYHKLAQATSGQVFQTYKNYVKYEMKIVEETITGRRVTLVNKIIPRYTIQRIPFHVDSYIDEILISATGEKAKIGLVTGPNGSMLAEIIIYGIDRTAIAKVTGPKPGDYDVEVGSYTDAHVVITAKTTLNLQLGFSLFRPTSIEDTNAVPEGNNTYMGVKLVCTGVKLTTANIFGLNDSMIVEISLELIDEMTQFYVTPTFDPPSITFYVSVSGYDIETQTPITRRGPAPITRLDL